MRTQQEALEGYCLSAQGKATARAGRLFALAMLAGACIALGAAGSLVAGLAGRIAGAAVFPVGLAMVVATGAELFTGNHLMLAPLLCGKIKLSGALRNFAIVYAGNFAGALLIAYLCFLADFQGMQDGAVAQSVMAAAQAKCALPFFALLARGVLCNLCVCGAVWMTLCARTLGSKIAALYGPIFLFVLCGFEHSVANMFIIPMGMLSGAEVSVLSFLLDNLLPVTLGNLLGGALMACAMRLSGGKAVAP